MLESRARATGAFFVTVQVGSATESSTQRTTPVRAVYVEKFLFDVRDVIAAVKYELWWILTDNCYCDGVLLWW